MIKDNTEIQDKLLNASAVELAFNQSLDGKTLIRWIYKVDERGIWRTSSPGAPSSLYRWELAQVIKDQEDDIYFQGTTYLNNATELSGS